MAHEAAERTESYADRFFRRIALAPDGGLVRAVMTGVAGAVLGLAFRLALQFVYGGAAGVIVFLPGVLLAALWAGRTAGFIALALSVTAAWSMTSLPGLFDADALRTTINTGAFAVVAGFGVVLAGSLRRTLRSLDRTVSALQTSASVLDESETRFRLVSEDAPVMLWMSDSEGACVYLNKAQRTFWGAPPDLADFDWTATLHPDDAPRVQAAALAAGQARTGFEVEARYRRHDGEWRILATTAQPRSDASGAFFGMIGVNMDVTEARRTEIALKESESELTAMVENAAAGIVKAELNGSIIKVNDRFCEMMGRSREDIIGKRTVDLTHPDDVEPTHRARRAALDLPEGASLEKRYVRGDGSVFWALTSIRKGRESQDAEPWLMIIVTDITDAKEAEAALRESEGRFRLLADTAPAPVWLTDADGAVEFVNEALVNFYGQPADALLGHAWIGTLHPEDIPGVMEAQAAARPQQLAYGFEARFANASGEWRWMRVGVKPRFDMDGVFLGYVGMSFDITETHQALENLRESEGRFRDIADTAPVLIWVTRADRVRAFVNQAYVAFMGGDYETVRTADWREYLHPDDHERVARESLAGEATGEPFSLEARYRHNSGEYRWLRSFSRPRISAAGEVIGFVGVAFDVNEEIKTQRDLQRINELLEERVGEALAEKERAEADLMHAQRMEAVGRLTGGVAHDFNNLLTVVIGALDMILKAPDDEARRQKMAEAALSAARRGERLTHQLLAFSRRQALRPEPCDLNALIRESEPLLRRAVGEAVDFRLKLRRGGARARVDAAQFEAALLNLVVNARDAVGGQGAITVTTQACKIKPGEITELAPGNYICVTVADDGEGMAPETLDRVFEPFFTTKAVGKGTGLGLSQVYGFTRQSGGGARIVSAPGEGAEVSMYLPPLTDAAPQEAPAVESVEIALDGQRVLLVEDDPSVAAVAMDLLRSFGLEVVAAENADQAIIALEASGFDLMLTDIIMPGGRNGVELAREAAARWPDMAIVLTTGYAGDDVESVLADASWPVLSKPYSTEGLRRAVSESLAHA